MSVVAVLYLVAAVVGYVSGAARARRRQAVAQPSGEVEAIPEPIVPGGPPPVLDADPFAPSRTRETGSETRGEAAADAFEPAATNQATPPEPSVQLSPAILEARPEEPSAVTVASTPTDETERIAALLASLQEQAERELAAAQAPAPVAPSAISDQAAAAAPPAAAVPPAITAPPTAAVPPAATVPPAAAVPPPAVPPAAAVPAAAAPPAPEYRLVAPVELHFTQGSGRIGVRPGTRTHDEFQRLANALLSELKQAQSRAQQ
ncbi:hypothetical protein emb_1c0236 [Coriobacteriaceae bacterium EMTCatB1]|nr:hypothetical protein emb_1c0236 [Coriobacteriaceae bacterium EMTCatB1]